MNTYEKIYDFCAVRNDGPCLSNNPEQPTPRVQFILDLLDELGIEWELDQFPMFDTSGWNVILPGGPRVVTAHHDIVNKDSDNAQDNSCSVINAIALKQLVPEITVVLLDGEEFGGQGSARFATQVNDGQYEVEWILNLELTGMGGKEFFMGKVREDNPLYQRVLETHECETHFVPFNDSLVFNVAGIPSVVLNPLPRLEDGKLDMRQLGICHRLEDSVDRISTDDMKEFVEEILVPIVQ